MFKHCLLMCNWRSLADTEHLEQAISFHTDYMQAAGAQAELFFWLTVEGYRVTAQQQLEAMQGWQKDGKKQPGATRGLLKAAALGVYEQYLSDKVGAMFPKACFQKSNIFRGPLLKKKDILNWLCSDRRLQESRWTRSWLQNWERICRKKTPHLKYLMKFREKYEKVASYLNRRTLSAVFYMLISYPPRHRCMTWCYGTSASTRPSSRVPSTSACSQSWTCWKSQATGDLTMAMASPSMAPLQEA